MKRCGTKWGLSSLCKKTKVMFFTNKKIREGMNLKLYGNNLERVESFGFLGVNFDFRLKWREHIGSTVKKCKAAINVMRCLVGLECSANLDKNRLWLCGVWIRSLCCQTWMFFRLEL